jgi:mannan endo-1,4-beta-mannosidase
MCRLRWPVWVSVIFTVALAMTMAFSAYPSAANEDAQFVTRSGSKLMLNGDPFRFSGSNMAWLGLTEDGGLRYPSHAEIDSAIVDAQAMGATVVRSHAVLSVGCSLCIQPTLGVFNDGTNGKRNAFDSIDYAIAVAKRHNIRLLFPLVDNYNYYVGGKFTYLRWRGIAADQVGSQFFTDPAVRSDFEQHITTVLNHVNPYTGVAYKDEPTIFAWETGNELSVYPDTWSHSEWTDSIPTYIKKRIGARQLVASGQYGIYAMNSKVDTASLALGQC